jgi:beta-lactamase class A
MCSDRTVIDNQDLQRWRQVPSNRRHLLCRRAVIATALMAVTAHRPLLAGAEPASPEALPALIDLTSAIDGIIPADGGVYGVVVHEPGRGTRYSRNPTVPFVAASLYKLPLMAHIYKLAEQGQFALTDTIVLDEWFWSEGTDSYYDHAWLGADIPIAELLDVMGAWSSNVAAWALSTLVFWPDVQATAREAGMINTWMFAITSEFETWPPPATSADSPEAMATAAAFIDAWYGWSPVMITTAEDIAIFFTGLLAGRVVSVEASMAILDILSRQMVTDRFPALLPAGTWMAHKTGNLPLVVHDAGLLYTASGPVVVVGMCESMADEWTAVQMLQQLAFIAYSAFAPSGA